MRETQENSDFSIRAFCPFSSVHIRTCSRLEATGRRELRVPESLCLVEG